MRSWPCARRRRGEGSLQGGEDEELAGPLYAASSSANTPSDRPPPARERMEGGAVRPPAAPPHPLPRRASRGEGAEEGLAGGCQGPASPSAVLTSPASPCATPAEAPLRRALFRGEGGRRRWRELTGGPGFCKGK